MPNGDILVAESGAPPDRPDNSRSIRRWAQGLLMSRARRLGENAQSHQRCCARQRRQLARWILQTTFLDKLYSPFGMAIVGGTFYVSSSNAVMTYLYTGKSSAT